MILGQLDIYMQNNIDTSFRKINTKMDKDLNVKFKTLKTPMKITQEKT